MLPTEKGYSVSDDCKDAITRLLVVDPAKRLDLEGLLAHPFVAQSLLPSDREQLEQAKAERAAMAARVAELEAGGGAGAEEYREEVATLRREVALRDRAIEQLSAQLAGAPAEEAKTGAEAEAPATGGGGGGAGFFDPGAERERLWRERA